MSRISDETLMAYADGELGPEEISAVERALAEDPALQAALERQRRLRATLAGHYAPVAEEPVPERLRALLEPKPAEVIDCAAARARRRPAFAWPHLAAMAASLAVGVLAGQVALSPGGGPVAVEDGTMVARGELAETLETQLASAQAAGASTRVGISFEDGEGRLCRTFQAPAMDGIACRGGEGWQLVMTAAGKGAATGQYRQASSPMVMEQAQAMMAGEPLDAAAESEARRSGWRRD